MDQKPSVGRIVHYNSAKGEVLPALITRVWNEDPGTCNLTVFTDGTDEDGAVATTVRKTSVVPGEPGEAGKWNWPPRV